MPEVIALPAGTRVWLVAGVIDRRCRFQGLAAKVQTALEDSQLGDNVFMFRGRRGDLVKLLWATDDGLWPLAKRLERGRFIWPQADGGKIVRAGARLHADYAGGEVGEELRNVISFEHFLQHGSAMLIYTMDGKNVLRQIDANCRNLHDERSPRSGGCFDTPTLAHRCRFGWVRPSH